MTTRGIASLVKKKISFQIIKYDHEEKGAEFAAEAIGFPLNQTIKTLVIDLGNKKYCFALMPGDKQLSLKKLAKICSVKRAAMVDQGTAERITGYQVGGISPFGSRQILKVVMETSLLTYQFVVINGGQRGILLKMTPKDIVDELNAQFAQII